MKKIEKWRVEELALLLDGLTALLRTSKNPEWAKIENQARSSSNLLRTLKTDSVTQR